MRFLTGKKLHRRAFLQGAGASLALPFLDAMLPVGLKAKTQGQTSAPHRFLAYYTPNGQAMPHWTPTGVGREFELSYILEPLSAFKDSLVAISGLDASWNYNHPGASGCFLTGTHSGATNTTDLLAETSIDQILAQRFGRETQVASLELALDRPANAGTCGPLSCAYTHTIAWRSPTQPVPMEYRPRSVFERLFGDAGSTDRGARAARMEEQRSILDSVTGKLLDLKRELGAADRRHLDQFTEAVRDVERRIELAEAQIDMELPTIAQPHGVPGTLEAHLELMLDLQLLAFQTDLTRVSTFMVGKELNARPYPQIGVPEAWHPLSHHRNIPELVAHMAKINRYHVEMFERYLQKLKATPDVDGSLLDSMTILYGSGMSNSQRHSGDNLPLLLVGGGNGRLQGGRHLLYEERPSHARLLVALLERFDVPIDSSVAQGPDGRVLEPLSGF